MLIIVKSLTFFSTITIVTSTVVSCMLVWDRSGVFGTPQQHAAELTVFLWDLNSGNSKGTQGERFYCAGSPSNSIPFSKRLIPCFNTSWCFADSSHWNCSGVAFCKFLKTECVWFHWQGMFPYFKWQKMIIFFSVRSQKNSTGQISFSSICEMCFSRTMHRAIQQADEDNWKKSWRSSHEII